MKRNMTLKQCLIFPRRPIDDFNYDDLYRSVVSLKGLKPSHFLTISGCWNLLKELQPWTLFDVMIGLNAEVRHDMMTRMCHRPCLVLSSSNLLGNFVGSWLKTFKGAITLMDISKWIRINYYNIESWTICLKQGHFGKYHNSWKGLSQTISEIGWLCSRTQVVS